MLHTPGVTLRLTAKLRLSDGTPLLLLLRTQGGVPSLRTLFMFWILIALYPSVLFCQVVFLYHWNTVFAILSHFFNFRNVHHMKLIKWLKIDSDTLQSGTQFRPHLVTYRMCYTQTVDFSMHSRENGSLCNTHFAQNSLCVTIKTPFKFAACRESVDLACNALFLPITSLDVIGVKRPVFQMLDRECCNNIFPADIIANKKEYQG